MPERIVAPQLNPNEAEVRLVSWIVTPWQRVEKGDLVCQVDTTKATFDIEAPAGGYFYPAAAVGAMVAVGAELGWLFPSPDTAQLASVDMPARSTNLIVSRKAQDLMSRHGLTPADFTGRSTIESADVLALVFTRMAAQKDERLDRLIVDASSIVIYGTGSMGLVAYDAFALSRPSAPIAFIDFAPRTADLLGLPVFHANHLPRLRTMGVRRMYVGLPTLAHELEVAREAERLGIELVSCIHPAAVVSPLARLGRNLFVGPLAIIGPNTNIGDFCRILNGASVAHDSSLGRGVRVTDGARIAGHVRVGHRALIGLDATVNYHLQIGNDVTVVSGGHVYEHVEDGCVVGVDGKVRRRLGA